MVLAVACAACGESKKTVFADRMEKTNNLRTIANLLVVLGSPLPMKDGALDVYALVQKGEITRENFALLRRPREDRPTDDEILRGDYTNFPYERYRGKAQLGSARPFPLLWDKTPDEHGVYVVAMSHGGAEAVDEAGMRAMLGR
jgi:hypothetical protein